MDQGGHGMQAPAVDELKQVFTKYAPEYLTDRSKAAAAYQQQGHGQGPGMGRFISAHLPGDSYVDMQKRKNLEGAMARTRDFSHKAFIASNPPNDGKARHGGWEGTFAARHGGYPHMFETTCPEKTKRWLGQVENRTGNTMPMLVKYPSKSAPGFPGRSIGGGDPAYESEFNFDKIEALNRQLKLGEGPGFRTEKKSSARPWINTGVHPRGFDGMAVFQDVQQQTTSRSGSSVSKAAQLASRPEHARPFISAAPTRRLPTETFGTFSYMGEDYVDNVSKQLDKIMAAQTKNRTMKASVKKIVHPPFKCSGSAGASNTPSVMFRRR